MTRVTAEQAAQEVRRQETTIGTHRPEFLVGAWHLGQRSGSARSGRIGTSDTQAIDKWFIFELMRIVSWQLLDPLLEFFLGRHRLLTQSPRPCLWQTTAPLALPR